MMMSGGWFVSPFRISIFSILFLALLIFLFCYPSVVRQDEESANVSWPNKNIERKCSVEEWNQKWSSDLPHPFSRWLWMRLNLSQEKNMNYTDISLFSAFVYPDYISVTITAQHLLKTKVMCRYLDCNRREIEGSQAESIVFPESIVYCPRRPEASFISITEKQEFKIEDDIPVTYRAYEEPVHEFSVCLAPLYGDEPKWLQIVEFIEHYKLQGATFFYVYIGTISEYDRKILDNYVRSGEVEVIQMRDKYERPFFSWHSIEIQDCHHRSKYHSKWTAFVDIDERIETFGFASVVDYLRSIQDDDVGEVQMMVKRIIKDEDVPPKYENVQKLYSEMIFRKFTNSTPPTWDASKAIIRPDKIGIMSIHYAVAKNPNVQTIKVKPEKMVLRHYRNDKQRMFGGNWTATHLTGFSTSRLDPKFAERLTSSVLNRVIKVYQTVPLECKLINENLWKSRQMADPCLEKPETFEN